jgi:hypothetical protein
MPNCVTNKDKSALIKSVVAHMRTSITVPEKITKTKTKVVVAKVKKEKGLSKAKQKKLNQVLNAIN